MKISQITLLLALLALASCTTTQTKEPDLAISNEDILDALKMEGIEIFKSKTGGYNKSLGFTLYIDEYKGDTLFNERVLYTSKPKENWEEHIDMVEQIRMISTVKNEKCQLSIETERYTLNRSFTVEKHYPRHFFQWRPYADCTYAMNKKVPIATYMSSWKGKKGYIHFCAPSTLGENDNTRKLYANSQYYFILSYKVSDQ